MWVIRDVYKVGQFLSTLSLRRATHFARSRPGSGFPISIHALLAESDQSRGSVSMPRYRFLSTLSLRRATLVNAFHGDLLEHFYPRSPCGERPTFIIYSIIDKCISIHALLAESDYPIALNACCRPGFLSTLSLRRATVAQGADFGYKMNFYPRSPCGERLRQNYECFNWIKFLSTLSLRRATWDLTGGLSCDAYFYPRSPCGERQRCHAADISARRISIHALLAESD